MAAGTNPPRVMQTMASKGPLSARRQANARASRWNWSQETGKDLREVGWTMLDPNLAQVLAPRGLDHRPSSSNRSWTRAWAAVARSLPVRYALLCPKPMQGVILHKKNFPRRPAAPIRQRRSGAEGS